MSNYQQGILPKITKARSKFKLDFNVKTSLNVGDLIPFYTQEVLPGDTFKIDTNIISRLASSFVKAPMDNLTLQQHYFFVPNRLIDDRWQELMGENKKTKWAQKEVIKNKKIKLGKVEAGDLLDYLGVPVGDYTNRAVNEVNAMYSLAYALVWNEWYRDQNVQDPVLIETSKRLYNNNQQPWSPSNFLGKPAKINKFQDYFTSCLPDTQKGNPIVLSLGGTAPLINEQLKLSDVNYTRTGGTIQTGAFLNSTITSNRINLTDTLPDNIQGKANVFIPTQADLTKATSISINDLRQSFQLQKMLERDARGGTRYIEIIQSHFGVESDDARLQRPEFLGGKNEPINISQVLNTSDTNTGNIAAFSHSQAQSYVSKSFTEYGIILGLVSIRQKHSYQQGLNKMFTRDVRTDYYSPEFANLGEQPVYQYEIFAGTAKKDNVFGYNEAWADYRYKPDMITGQMRSDSNNGYGVWHFGDNYANAPVLSDEFVKETEIFVDRTISVTSKVAHQFILDIYCDNTAIRTMPTYSVPGNIDSN